ncbi:hypothetical protein GCM10022280_01550 [Sphingomonas swuensis]|uniref:DUF4402 domain-containing protein n=1 Tax=Sphingomonas swuensis TaxID=977800 RepID=A0ABP7S905_9SPHN
MKKLIIAAAALAAVTAATPAAAQATSSTPRATANARLIKPLTLTALRNLDFGTIVIGSASVADVVSINAAGVVSCGSSGNLSCSGSPTSAGYRITGTQGQVVVVSSASPSYTLTGSNGGTLAFTPVLPANITLGNSGAPGNDFSVGGSIALAANQQDGLYSGQIDIQVAYQ